MKLSPAPRGPQTSGEEIRRSSRRRIPSRYRQDKGHEEKYRRLLLMTYDGYELPGSGGSAFFDPETRLLPSGLRLHFIDKMALNVKRDRRNLVNTYWL